MNNLFEVIKKRNRGKKEDEMRGNVTSQYSHFVPLRRLVLEKWDLANRRRI